jgi:hypothetical protein
VICIEPLVRVNHWPVDSEIFLIGPWLWSVRKDGADLLRCCRLTLVADLEALHQRTHGVAEAAILQL